MLAVLLLSAFTTGLAAAAASLLAGQSVLFAIGAYAVCGALGMLGAAAVLWLLRDRWRHLMDDDDADISAARLVRAAWAGAPEGRIVPLEAGRRAAAPRRTAREAGPAFDRRLAPGWMFEAGRWPEAMPPDLRLRLLDATGDGGASLDDLWEEVRAWLEEHSVPPSAEPGRRVVGRGGDGPAVRSPVPAPEAGAGPCADNVIPVHAAAQAAEPPRTRVDLGSLATYCVAQMQAARTPEERRAAERLAVEVLRASAGPAATDEADPATDRTRQRDR